MPSTLTDDVTHYCATTRADDAEPSSTETTFYPHVRALLASILKEERLPFEVRVGTSHAGGGGRDMPDFTLSDRDGFVGVYGEVKRAGTSLEDMSVSTERNDQIGRYLAQTGIVILCNVRGFGLLTCDPAHSRDGVSPVPPVARRLGATVDLWSAATLGVRPKVDTGAVRSLRDLVAAAVTDHARIASPADLARILARQARAAKDAMPDDLAPVKPLLDDYRDALGLAFDLEDEKGGRFFRSSLVQSVFYALFAAWVLWDRTAPEGATFDVEDAHAHLPIPFLGALLHDIRHPSRMRHLGLRPHLDGAVRTLNRVDRALFRGRMTFPSLDGDSATAAITYFYEPFLEAFDPQLREDLGVWYTPPEIVRYQVRRVHHLLKAELGRPRGLADPDVVVLDPCCGTGAYLLEVARCVHDELKATGDEATLGLDLAEAFRTRIVGFEILTAPFAIAQLQLHLLLSALGARAEDGRLAVYLTNALSGWHDEGDVKLSFPEMAEERDASRRVKRKARIIVVIGNPPYDRFAGVAQAEEAELVAHYKGVELVTKTNKDGTLRLDRFGRPERFPKGESLLHKEFGVRKQLLDDLYVRFLRMAEERIGVSAEDGIVSFISNSSYLTGRSHPRMRRSLLGSFDAVWIDNLNGDKYRTGKVIPKDLPGAGTRDDSAFSTAADPRGIQPGTAVVTWVKRRGPQGGPGATAVLYRDLWGRAADKRAALLASLPAGEPASPGASPAYEALAPSQATRWRLSPRTVEGGYEAWPGLDELFPARLQGVNHNRGVEGGVIDADADRLSRRIASYFAAPTFEEAAQTVPEVAAARARYDAEAAWVKLRGEGHFRQDAVLPFLTFPLDQRHIYYSDQHKWLNEARGDYFDNLVGNEFLLTVPEPRKASETRPVFATVLANLHVHERGSVVIPRETAASGLLAAQRDANLPEPTWRVWKKHLGLEGDRSSADARALAGRLLRVALAVLHAPAYQAEHASGLAADWAHLPIPRDPDLLDHVAQAGETVARLLDDGRPVRDVVDTVLSPARASRLGALARVDGGPLRPEDLAVTITYWGGGKGRWRARPFEDDERPDEAWAKAWGDRTGNLWLSDAAFLSHVPEAVWLYQLGGYPVLKKWLGYRQANRREGRPLDAGERRRLREVVQRIATLLALGPKLDGLYQEAAAEAFTAEELGLVR